MANEMDSAAGALMHIVHSRPGTPPSEEQQKPIQAYAKLQGEDFVYYVRTLSVLLGRKTSPGDDVQVDLGTSKIISRVHARIEYNFVSRSFEIACLGKNGVFVDGKFITKDSQAVPLETKTLVQIGERWFYFLLPISPIQQSKPLGEELKQRLVEAGAASQPAQPSHSSNSPSATVPNSPADSRAGSPNNEDLPDYRLYADVKPPFSYASLIAQAINSSNDKRLTLSSIYQFITEHYPYYRTAQNGWQNSIRHNLSLNKAFVKMARAEHEPGKGAFWTIDSQYEHLFQSGDSTSGKRRVRPSSKPSKATTSPSGSKESEPEITSPTPQRKRQKPEDNSPEPKKSKPSTPTLGTDKDKDKDREKEKEGDKEKEKENENENESEKEKEKEKEKEIEKEIENGAKAPSAEPSLEQPDPPQ